MSEEFCGVPQFVGFKLMTAFILQNSKWNQIKWNNTQIRKKIKNKSHEYNLSNSLMSLLVGWLVGNYQ